MARETTSFKIMGPSLKPWIKDLKKYEAEPTIKTRAALSAVLNSAAVQARVNTHVITGRLLSSLEIEDNYLNTQRTKKWQGRLALGKGVPYAKYEIGDRRRGVRADWAAHPFHRDPFDDLGDIHYEAVEAILNAL